MDRVGSGPRHSMGDKGDEGRVQKKTDDEKKGMEEIPDGGIGKGSQ